jgi:deoxyribose-phosphate aldolase
MRLAIGPGGNQLEAVAANDVPRARSSRSSAPLSAGVHNQVRNPGMALDLSWVLDSRVNLSATERRVASLPGRRTVKKDAQAAWLLKAVTCIDLTTLNGDDTTERVKRLCAKAISPVRPEILDALGMGDRIITTGAICVYHRLL